MKVLVIDDDKAVNLFLCEAVKVGNHLPLAAYSGAEGISKLESFHPDVILLDINMPGISGFEVLSNVKPRFPEIEVVIITGVADIKGAVQAMKSGAADYLAKPVNLEELLVVLAKLEDKIRMGEELRSMRQAAKEQVRRDYLFLNNEQMQKIYTEIDQVAAQEHVTVLIDGETGTGKEHVARLIHMSSPRAARPFVEIHCGALPENLLEAELFGYEPGAFTDAKKAKPGLFELAERGTIFLDEIGEMTLSTQVKLLKVLEQKRVRRLGGLKENQLDVRIVAATNRDLQEEVKANRFRSDLYYRLNVFSIKIPPLRERPQDIEDLTRFFFEDACRVFSKKFRPVSDEVIALFLKHSWPGNVRELKNVVERMVITAQGEQIEVRDIPREILPKEVALALADPGMGLGPLKTRHDAEKEAILNALRHTQGNRTQAAELLGFSRKTLFNKLKRYGMQQN